MTEQSAELLESPAVETFPRQLAEAWRPQHWTPHRVLIAVSGGPDSVALLRAVHRLALQARGDCDNLAVAHLNHGQRGQESDQDQEFVEVLAKNLRIPVFCQRLDWKSLREMARNGIESEARSARYNVLIRMAHDWGARYLTTGHTLDDQVETVLFRIVRGTGIGGLAGIPFLRLVDDGLSIIRPILGLRRSAVVRYLSELGQDYCHDSSNENVDFASRNWIRFDLLPLLRTKFNENIDMSFARLAMVANEQQEFIMTLAEPLLDRAVKVATPYMVVMRREVFANQSPVVVQAALQCIWRRQDWPQREMGFNHWRRLVEMVTSPSQTRSSAEFPRQIWALCDGGEVQLRQSD